MGFAIDEIERLSSGHGDLFPSFQPPGSNRIVSSNYQTSMHMTNNCVMHDFTASLIPIKLCEIILKLSPIFITLFVVMDHSPFCPPCTTCMCQLSSASQPLTCALIGIEWRQCALDLAAAAGDRGCH